MINLVVCSVTAELQGDTYVLGHTVYGPVHYKARTFTSQQKYECEDRSVGRCDIISECIRLTQLASVTVLVANDVSSTSVFKYHIPTCA
jgi:hypothetical protein